MTPPLPGIPAQCDRHPGRGRRRPLADTQAALDGIPDRSGERAQGLGDTQGALLTAEKIPEAVSSGLQDVTAQEHPGRPEPAPRKLLTSRRQEDVRPQADQAQVPLAAMQSELEEARGSLRNVITLQAEAESALAQKQQELDQALAQLTETQAQMTEIDQAMQEQKNSDVVAQEALNATLEKVTAKKEAAETELADARQQLADIRAQLETQQQTDADLQAELESARSSLRNLISLQAQAESALEELAAKQEESEAAQSELEEARMSLKNVIALQAETDAALSAAQERIAELEEIAAKQGGGGGTEAACSPPGIRGRHAGGAERRQGFPARPDQFAG